MTRTDLTDQIEDNQATMYEYYFQKGIQESQSSATSLLGNVQATYNPCQATSMPDATKTAFTKSLWMGSYRPMSHRA